MKSRNDIDEFFEIDILITDINMNEFSEILLYPKSNVAIIWDDNEVNGFRYLSTPEEVLINEIPYMRNNILHMFELKSRNVYNLDNMIRFKIGKLRWKKV